MKRVSAAAVGLALLVCGCGGGDEGTEGEAVTGTMTMIGSPLHMTFTEPGQLGESCEGREGFDDISAGAQVIISDEAGTSIGSGRLDPGEIIDVYKKDSSIITCEWSFTVADVPDANFYEVEVSDRGGAKYSQAEMEQMGWSVSLSIETN